jgi:6-phosphofructokinase 1
VPRPQRRHPRPGARAARHYGVRRIVGFRNGYRGFIPRYGEDVVDLTPGGRQRHRRRGRHRSSAPPAGSRTPEEIVDALERLNINILFVIGGDGTIRGAMDVVRVVGERGLKVAVVGIPRRSTTTSPTSTRASASRPRWPRRPSHPRGQRRGPLAPGGIGLVKLMGRHSGFIACYSTLAKDDADYVLIPEVPFALDGERGFLEHLRRRVQERGHAGGGRGRGAGQEHIEEEEPGRDASGNVRSATSAGCCAGDHRAPRRAGVENNVRYFDPSYAIRSVPGERLRQRLLPAPGARGGARGDGRAHREHRARRRRRRFVHIPMALAVSRRNHVDPLGDLWMSVLEATGQPVRFE